MDEPSRLDDTRSAASTLGELRAPVGPSSEDWPEGLVAVGGRLDTQTLLAAYRSGVFPWSSDPAVTWWSPDPRAIFDLDTWRAHRTIARSARRNGWTFSIDRAFEDVMRACAEAKPDRPSTWITDDFVRAYGELHRRGLAHSIEVWQGEPGGTLVGGLYGVTLGGFFGGESMFHRATDASKAAVAYLVDRLRAGGFTLLDAQMQTAHLERLGAITIRRDDYLRRLRHALRRPARLAE
ncbi:MAG TPA: leucyl/phenylalanyl-tRNA--protein transferase [Polyangia bacterium]|nr:leucyl/phenylalanyl-tRNA--protein transferase [Polyangia bacterium]